MKLNQLVTEVKKSSAPKWMYSGKSSDIPKDVMSLVEKTLAKAGLKLASKFSYDKRSSVYGAKITRTKFKSDEKKMTTSHEGDKCYLGNPDGDSAYDYGIMFGDASVDLDNGNTRHVGADVLLKNGKEV